MFLIIVYGVRIKPGAISPLAAASLAGCGRKERWMRIGQNFMPNKECA
tara:strand:- start:460 stop:603 length:144 start_codon:yes stop_codon:yes gene_type:complete